MRQVYNSVLIIMKLSSRFIKYFTNYRIVITNTDSIHNLYRVLLFVYKKISWLGKQIANDTSFKILPKYNNAPVYHIQHAMHQEMQFTILVLNFFFTDVKSIESVICDYDNSWSVRGLVISVLA